MRENDTLLKSLETRDMAVQANTKIDHHLLDCAQFREALRSDFKEFRDDLKRLNWRIAIMIGGLVVLSHGIDWLVSLHK